MPTHRRPLPVKLFAALLGGDPGLLRRARQLLVRRFGPLDLESEIWPFDQTDYYEPEMGPDLKRCFLSFETPIDPGALSGIKCETCALERQLAEELQEFPHQVEGFEWTWQFPVETVTELPESVEYDWQSPQKPGALRFLAREHGQVAPE